MNNKPIQNFNGPKDYLGDGVYIRAVHDGVWLTTEDGIDVTNEIHLDERSMQAFIRFITSTCEKPATKRPVIQ